MFDPHAFLAHNIQPGLQCDASTHEGAVLLQLREDTIHPTFLRGGVSHSFGMNLPQNSSWWADLPKPEKF